MDDSTFKAFMRDRDFLKSILPVTDELNCIFKRIFEVNPQRRISLDELRHLIIHCPRLTTMGSSVPVTPPYSPVEKPVDSRPNSAFGAYEPVPHLDLPAQQFPTSNPGFIPSGQSIMFTPPGSGQCSPQQTLYAAPPKPVAPVISGHIFGNLPDFRRCGQMLSNLSIPANHMWTPSY